MTDWVCSVDNPTGFVILWGNALTNALPNMQYLSLVTATDRCSLSTKLTGDISDKLSSIFSVFLPSEPE